MALDKQQQHMIGPTLGLTEAAEELDVHASTVRRYIREGRLPAHKVEGPHGPEWRVTADDVKAFAQGGQEVQGGLRESDSSLVQELDERLAHLAQTISTRLNEISEGQKALEPSLEERQARADRERRIEEALTGNSARIEELAREAEQQRIRAETAEAKVLELENERDGLRRELSVERSKPWWHRLTGRGMKTEDH
ncbi:MAG: helix-turn-helix domain-containing protein [candidate division WS1 bacterium]|jgi:excisionase family DNA binding protein|nr:helix-turn-helix domain-containing protein [candidate division WS1 bacterium]